MKHLGFFRRRQEMSLLRWLLFTFLGFIACVVAIAGIAAFAFYIQLDRSLPSARALKNYHPSLVSSVYASDGSLIGEFYTERRFLVPLDRVPPYLIKAFLAAEDSRFYEHGGVDLPGIFRAFMKNLQAGEIVQGGSTITQQVVKSLLLTPERTVIRKLKEALLAYRIDHTLSKDEILYLYLNQIYFGSGAYGVEAAAQTYFDKHVEDLDLAEASLLAGLPKAPTRFSPHQNYASAKDRQRYVLDRMVEVGFITQEERDKAFVEPLNLARPKRWRLKEFNHFTEEVRRQVEAKYGRDGLYKEGLKIYTTLDLRAQEMAEKALDQGLRQLDKRHSRYRGINLNVPREDWPSALRVLNSTNGELQPEKIVAALVMDYDPQSRSCRLQIGDAQGILPSSGWQWAKISDKRASKMFRVGDLVRVRLENLQSDKTWTTVLEQDPGMEGAFMAMVPQTGRVLCLVGGRNFAQSQFNRATQAIRQPGSAFKPIIYSAALDKGYTEASILIDSPIVLNDHSLRGLWKPANYDHQFWGPILLRKALIHSRNVVTVKLLNAIGVDYAIQYARNLGITSPLTPTLALALGASGVSLWELLTAYTPFANQGKRVDPYMIEKIEDRDGNILEEHRVAPEDVISPETAYVMTDLLAGVVQEGTAKKAKELDRPAAGKTGTTNEMRDAWFIGYTPDVLAGVWVGYDDHNVSLGKGETGGRAACPIWVSFMKEWLKEKPVESFPIPSGVVFAKINGHTGALARSNDPSAVSAAFVGEVPVRSQRYSAPSQKSGNSSPASSDTASATVSSSPAESFFKSDLF
ncbi:penicillin-binding protein 1A [Desulforhabdus amnigena]|jgi:penicillin-binding protein 1A|uniref:peptidoglycan glycosyltransferase n=1 Tax=Desulforhabdus amnigena TaxID=40218 RepID=A0A9W6FVF6_9BACT|nr:PBP1A family penicillin-binding protein [Desulforhabdus amnigena]NLJ28021.1 PBP1A family penicillin-binding protein [Deltaproteobacteria bacterium]GLI35552.1 penicillin-binding protein [Desulforhabdus amnigena]